MSVMLGLNPAGAADYALKHLEWKRFPEFRDHRQALCDALVAAQGVLIPIQCEYYALEGVSALMGTIQKVQRINRRLNIEGVVLTMLDARTNLSIQVAQEVRRHFPGKVFATSIPRNVRLAEAPSHGLPITAYDRSSRGAVAYRAMAEEIKAKLELGVRS